MARRGNGSSNSVWYTRQKGPASSNAASGKRSNAIKIVKPPSDYKEPEEPRGNRGNQQNGKKGKTFNDLFFYVTPCKTESNNHISLTYIISHLKAQHTNNKPVPQATPDTPELTEAELRFMSEQMGDTDSECMTAGGESDIGSECGMPEEVEAAYQEFLNEQAKASKESK